MERLRIAPSPTLISRYLALVAEVSDAQEKQGHALALAEALVPSEPDRALQIAHMTYRSDPKNARALDVMIAVMTAKGRYGKAEVLRNERARLDGPQKTALLDSGPSMAAAGLGAAVLATFQQQHLGKIPVAQSPRRPAGVAERPNFKLDEAPVAAFVGSPFVAPVAALEAYRELDEIAFATPHRGGKSELSGLFPEGAENAAHNQAKAAVNPHPAPAAVERSPAKSAPAQEPAAEVSLSLDGLDEAPPAQAYAPPPANPRARHYAGVSEDAFAGNVPGAHGEAEEPKPRARRKRPVTDYGEAAAITPELMDAAARAYAQHAASQQAQALAAQAMAAQVMAAQAFAAQGLIAKTADAGDAATQPRSAAVPMGSTAFWQPLQSAISKMARVGSPPPVAAETGAGPVARGTSEHAAARLEQILAGLNPATPPEAHQALIWDLVQSLWGAAPDAECARFLEAQGLSTFDPGFFGLFLDALLGGGSARRAHALVQRLLSDKPQLAWAKAAYRRVPRIYAGLGAKPIVWVEDEGVEALRKRLEARPEPSLRAMVLAAPTG